MAIFGLFIDIHWLNMDIYRLDIDLYGPDMDIYRLNLAICGFVFAIFVLHKDIEDCQFRTFFLDLLTSNRHGHINISNHNIYLCIYYLESPLAISSRFWSSLDSTSIDWWMPPEEWVPGLFARPGWLSLHFKVIIFMP